MALIGAEGASRRWRSWPGSPCWRRLPTGAGHTRSAATVVASTDVWGSVARAVTGGHVAVTSILTGAQTDPHSYQATPSDAAAIADAALVVYNGGGYDPWVDQVLSRASVRRLGRRLLVRHERHRPAGGNRPTSTSSTT